MWREDQVKDNVITPLQKENIFSFSSTNMELDSDIIRPGIYIGMHNRQMYVQENPFFQKTIEYSTSPEVKYPWIPHPAIGMKRNIRFFLHLTN